MKFTLAFLGLALAFCAASANADDVTSADVAELTIDQQINIAVALTNQTETVDASDESGLPPATVEIAYNTSDSTVDVVVPDAVSKRAFSNTRYNLGNIAKKRAAGDYVLHTSGRQASLSAPWYLTYKVLKATTVEDAYTQCKAFCDTVSSCKSANVYQEFNNPGLPAPPANWKCALYGDVTAEKQLTNKGGQNLGGGGLTYIQNSAIFNRANPTFDSPTVPGYTKVFGPLTAATSAGAARGYMGYTALSQYSVTKCAALCDTRTADRVGGRCKFFNLWRGVVNGVATTYTCAFFYENTDASTATNNGDPVNKVTITDSVGYNLNYNAP